jgi:hypothetical protein
MSGTGIPYFKVFSDISLDIAELTTLITRESTNRQQRALLFLSIVIL